MYFTLLVFSISTDCPSVIAMALSLSMNTANPAIYLQIQTNCCSATGVACDGLTRVTSINWNTMGLTGSIASSNLPSTLTFLNLSYNSITGSIPSLPSLLSSLYLQKNQFTGSLPSTMPVGLSNLDVSYNSFSGSIPATIQPGISILYFQKNMFNGSIPFLPNGITVIDFSYNALSGSIPSLPSSLNILYLQHNKLAGAIPTLPPTLATADFSVNLLTGYGTFPTTLSLLALANNQISTFSSIPSWITSVDLGNNALSGLIPSGLPSGLLTLIVSNNFLSGVVPTLPSTLTKLDLSLNQLSGTVASNAPTTFKINGNQFTTVAISNTGFLTVCDLSNNPLLGSSGIAALSMCSKNNLFMLLSTTSKVALTSVIATQLTTSTKAKTVQLVSSTIPSIAYVHIQSTETTPLLSMRSEPVRVYEIPSSKLSTFASVILSHATLKVAERKSKLTTVVFGTPLISNSGLVTLNLLGGFRVFISISILAYVAYKLRKRSTSKHSKKKKEANNVSIE